MKTKIITLLYTGGILQCLVLLAVIVKSKVLAKKSNQLLLALLTAIIIVLIQYLSILELIGLKTRLISELGTVSWFALGPLFYLYALTQSKTHFHFQKWHWLLFMAPLYNSLQYVVSHVQPGLSLYHLFNNGVIYSYAWLTAYQLHTLVFVFLSIFAIKKQLTSKNKGLLHFFYLWLGILLTATAYLIVSINSTVYFSELEMYLVVVFNIFILMLTYRSLLTTTAFDAEGASQTKDLKYSNSSLSKNELEHLHTRLVATMESEKPYMDRKLNLTQLSKVSGIRENQLSQIFSQHLKSNFYDFISQYRLIEVEQRLNNPKYAHLKIISLAEDCGFNSKAAFYKTFKEKHQLTPTQYLKQRKAS